MFRASENVLFLQAMVLVAVVLVQALPRPLSFISCEWVLNGSETLSPFLQSIVDNCDIRAVVRIQWVDLWNVTAVDWSSFSSLSYSPYPLPLVRMSSCVVGHVYSFFEVYMSWSSHNIKSINFLPCLPFSLPSLLFSFIQSLAYMDQAGLELIILLPQKFWDYRHVLLK